MTLYCRQISESVNRVAQLVTAWVYGQSSVSPQVYDRWGLKASIASWYSGKFQAATGKV